MRDLSQCCSQFWWLFLDPVSAQGGTADGSFTVWVCCSVSLQPFREQVSKHKTQPVMMGVKHAPGAQHRGETESLDEPPSQTCCSCTAFMVFSHVKVCNSYLNGLDLNSRHLFEQIFFISVVTRI